MLRLLALWVITPFAVVSVARCDLPARRGGLDQHRPGARAGLAHRHPVGRRRHAAAGDLRGRRAWRSESACSMTTWFQSQSSSSAISIGSIVLMPWPISGFLETIVTRPSGAIETKVESRAASFAAVPLIAADSRPGQQSLRAPARRRPAARRARSVRRSMPGADRIMLHRCASFVPAAIWIASWMRV